MPNPWVDQDGKDHYLAKGIVLLVLFTIESFLLITSIIKTIITQPGGIPDDTEWDMLSENLTDGRGESD
jgi:hypothetical protein